MGDHNDDQIDVYFVQKTLNFERSGAQKVKGKLSVEMMIGIIDQALDNSYYFPFERAGSIGLCPSTQSDDETLLQRQFLYQVA